MIDCLDCEAASDIARLGELKPQGINAALEF